MFASPYLTHAADIDIEKELQQGLEESRSVIARAKEKLTNGDPITTQVERLKAIAEDIRVSHLLMQERFRSREEDAEQLGGKALARHHAVVERYRHALETYLTLIENLPSDDGLSDPDLDDLQTLLDGLLYQTTPLIYGSLPYRHLRYPLHQPETDPAITPAYQGDNLSVTPADLAPTVEAPRAEAIVTLAESLNWQPVEIYEWVKNNVETEWYWGCIIELWYIKT